MMSDLSELLDDLVDRRTGAASGSSPLDGTTNAIRRNRATRQSLTAVASIVGLGALFAGGTAAARYYASIEPAAYDLPPGGGMVRIAADGPDPTEPTTRIECGDSAPQPALSTDGFQLELMYDTQAKNDAAGPNVLGGSAAVRNLNTEVFPGFLAQPQVAIVKDGAVVALRGGGGTSNRFYFTPERTQLNGDFMAHGWGTCADEDALLAPGDYEYYVVATVANSPEIAALSKITTMFGQVPLFNGDRWLEPTDWECVNGIYAAYDQRISAYTSGIPAACIPAEHGLITWDPNERALVLPYNDATVRRVFSSQLVAGPFPYRVEPWSDQDLAGFDLNADQAPLTDANAQCGAHIPWRPSAIDVDLFTVDMGRNHLAEQPTMATTAWPFFGPGGVESRTARVSVPGRGRAYITTQADYYNEAADAWTWGDVVVGHAWVTVNDGNDITVARAEGPGAVDFAIEVEDITWCGEAMPNELLSMTVNGDLTVTSDAGSRTMDEYHIRGGLAG